MSATNRKCPQCASASIRIKDLLFGDCRCRKCRSVVGIHRIASVLSSIVIFVVAIVTTLIVFIELDLYAALLWFTLPVGALSYLKARFLPLVTRPRTRASEETHSASHRPG
mgnify:CR=1